MSSNSSLIPIHCVIFCQDDLTKSTNLNLPLPWSKLFKGFLIIHLVDKAGPSEVPAAPGTAASQHSHSFTYFTTYHTSNICCLHRTLGCSLVSGSLWALYKSLRSDSQGPCMQGLEHPAGRLPLHLPWRGAYWGWRAHTCEASAYGSVVKILFATHPKNSPGLGI